MGKVRVPRLSESEVWEFAEHYVVNPMYAAELVHGELGDSAKTRLQRLAIEQVAVQMVSVLSPDTRTHFARKYVRSMLQGDPGFLDRYRWNGHICHCDHTTCGMP